MWTKHIIALSLLWPDREGPIVALPTKAQWACVHVCVCVWGGYSLMPSQYAIVLQTSTVIYVKILSLLSSHPWLLLFLAPSWSPTTPLPSHNVMQCTFFAHSILLLHISASLPGYLPPWPSSNINANFDVLHRDIPSLHSLNSFIPHLFVSCTPPSG